MKRNVPFKGNIIFSSKYAFEQFSLSRRDDIISLLYFLIFCIKSDLNWIDNSKPLSVQIEKICKYKIEASPK